LERRQLGQSQQKLGFGKIEKTDQVVVSPKLFPFCTAVLWCLSNFNRSRWTLQLTRKTLNALRFAGWVSFSVRKGVPRRVHHLVERHGADVCAYAVSDAYIPIHRNVCSMDSKGCWGFNGTPDFVATMLASGLAFSLKIRINRQNKSPIKLRRREHIRISTNHFGNSA